jgi:hypothetical protein
MNQKSRRKPPEPQTKEHPVLALVRVGRASDLVRGGGGMSGQDRAQYYYFTQDE